jgi:phenylacetate-CoA ligase
MNPEMITDGERYPTLTEAGQRMLDFLREHPQAPIFRNQSGNRLTVEDVARVREFDLQTQAADVGWPSGELPDWTREFVEHCQSDVPFYRRYGSVPADFHDLPTISRPTWAATSRNLSRIRRRLIV